jgi:predicted nucleic acid-binding protein
LIAYLQGEQSALTEAVEMVLADHQACLPPVVLTEVTSDPKLRGDVADLVRGLPLLGVEDGYWDRAGILRRRMLSRGYKARLADTLVAQSCLDHKVALITTDKDFSRFAKVGGLRLTP